MRKLTTTSLYVIPILFLSFTVQPALSANAMAVASTLTALNGPPSKEMLQVAKMRWFANLSTEQYSRLRGKKLNHPAKNFLVIKGVTPGPDSRNTGAYFYE